LISIIIPSYRQPQFLGRAIESCLEQDHRDLEVIVVDDHSRDASLGLAVSYSVQDHRVRVVAAPENGGLGRARNIGLAHAAGEFVCFLDADDYLLASSLSSRLAEFPAAQERHGDALVAVYGDWQHVSEFVDEPVVRAPRQNMPVVSASTYTGENVFICSAPLVRRNAVLEAGGFPEGLPMLEDFSLWARMLAAGGVFSPVEHVVATYRQRPNSMLRGDGVAVMADYATIINDWMAANDIALHDGGALDAWLAGRSPHPFGQMSWTLPSPPGYFSEESDVPDESAALAPSSQADVADFMTDVENGGLQNPPALFTHDETPFDIVLLVDSFEQSLAAADIIDSLAGSDTAVAVYSLDPTAWPAHWPLALAHTWPRAYPIPEDAEVVDPAQPSPRLAAELRTLSEIVDRLCPPLPNDPPVVYVSEPLMGYPALDAWVSVALSAFVNLGLEPVLVSDPAMREHLGGWRSTLFALDIVSSARAVIAPPGSASELVGQLAPTVIFDPAGTDPGAIRTATELRAAIEEGQSG